MIGGGGMIGRRVVREALDRAHLLTLVVRDASRVTVNDERVTRPRWRTTPFALVDEAEAATHVCRRFTVGY